MVKANFTDTPAALEARNHLIGSMGMNEAIMQARAAGAAGQSLAASQASDVNTQAIAAVAGISKDVQIG